MNLGLEGRTAIVCGASAGMGLAIAEALAIAPGTVAAALHAAHGSIRNSLQEVRT